MSHFADAGFASTLKPLLDQWLNNANVSYQALNQLLSTVPEIGELPVKPPGNAYLERLPSACQLPEQYISKQGLGGPQLQGVPYFSRACEGRLVTKP